MNNNLDIINKYFLILKNTGYIDYNSVYNILAYLSLHEILISWDWDDYTRMEYNNILDKLKNCECIMNMRNSCYNSINSNRQYIFGFYDLPNIPYISSTMYEFQKMMEDDTLFAVQNEDKNK